MIISHLISLTIMIVSILQWIKKIIKKKNTVPIIRKPKLIVIKPKRSKSISIQTRRSINSKDTYYNLKFTQKTIKKKKTLKF